MDNHLKQIDSLIYKPCNLIITEFEVKRESKEYAACSFKLNGKSIHSRNAKITPKKIGQFVTFWKRNGNGPIEPFEETDVIDYFIVNVKTENKFGQFVFPKSILIKKGIISTANKEGKRAFRVYPKWDIPTSKQAERNQKWQLNYFYEVTNQVDFNKVTFLYDSK